MSQGSAPVAAASSRERFAKPLFLATIVTGSFLLFLTQPMVARMALPRIGGAPAVWNSAMLVFQALLLGGYAYAHGVSRIAPRRQAGLHLALFAIAALWLPIGLSPMLRPAAAEPTLWVPWFLVSSIGPLFFIISAQAPLMQRWYALESQRGEPYALYAASNLGSFAGLISYPLLVEPLLTLEQQSLVWTAGFGLLILLVGGCALTIPADAVEAAPRERSPSPGARRVAHWILLAFVPSGLMLSTTTHLTTDIVAVPLLWALPLGLYLLSFVTAFASGRRPADLLTQIAPLVLLIAGSFAFSDGSSRPLLSASLGLALLFVVAVALHAEMYRLRPAADRLTGFYLAMAVGGVLGGLFCAILAPTLFDWAYEHPLLVLLAAFLIPQSALLPQFDHLPRWLLPSMLVLAWPLSYAADKRLWPPLPDTVLIAISVFLALLALLSLGRRLVFVGALLALMMSYGGWATLYTSFQDVRTRSYFGIYGVSNRADGSARLLTHGTTLHGIQNLRPGQQTYPTTYYTPASGVGRVLAASETLYGPGAHIGVIGLGTGTLACYAKPGQQWRFFEIDPAMVALARDTRRFTFLSRCAPQAGIVLGDARLSMADQPAGRLDILAVDAFSSDAVPMHLLTREAIDTYARAMRPNGILMFHVSNRYIELEPVLAAAARERGWRALLLDYRPPPEDVARNATMSVWVAMSASHQKIEDMIAASGPDALWTELEDRPDFEGWTDDYATIIPLLKLWDD